MTAATVRKHLRKGPILGTLLALTACSAIVDPFSGRGEACDILAIGKPATATLLTLKEYMEVEGAAADERCTTTPA